MDCIIYEWPIILKFDFLVKPRYFKKWLFTIYMHTLNVFFKKICSIFFTALSLKSMQVIEDNNLKGVRCDVCGRMLSCNRSLSDHKRQVHDKSNHIKCDLCNFTTFQPYMLKRHKQRNHDKSTKYDCEMCDFFTYDKGRLRVHKRGVHEKIKPHKCTECTSTYQTKYRLAVHMLREHNIVYKYK